MGDEFHVWKQHFIDQARGLIPHQRNFYKVSEQKGKGDQPSIKLVSPTEQVVERAKSTLSDPPMVYDPVTGVTNQPINETIKKKRTYKRKRKTDKKKKIKKRKKGKKPNKKGKEKGKKKKWWDM